MSIVLIKRDRVTAILCVAATLFLNVLKDTTCGTKG